MELTKNCSEKSNTFHPCNFNLCHKFKWEDHENWYEFKVKCQFHCVEATEEAPK